MRLSEDWYKRLEEDIEVQEIAGQYKKRLENLLYKNSRSQLNEWVYKAPYGTKQAKKYNETDYKTDIEPLVKQAIDAIETIKTKEDLKNFEAEFVRNPKLKRFIDFKGGNRASNDTPDENEIKKPFTFYNEHDLNNIKNKIKQEENQKEIDDYEAQVRARDEEEKRLYSPRTRELLNKFRRGTISKEEEEELRYLIKTSQAPDSTENGGNIQTPKESEQIPEGDPTETKLHTDWYGLRHRAVLYWAKKAKSDPNEMDKYGITSEDDTGGGVWTRNPGTQMAVIAKNGHVVYPNAATAIKDNYRLSKDIDITKLTTEERRKLIMQATKMGNKIYNACEGKLLKFGKGGTTEDTVCGLIWRYATPKEIELAINSAEDKEGNKMAVKNRYHVNGEEI